MREDWVEVELGRISEVNPKIKNKDEIDDDFMVQFLPMRLVDEQTGKIHLVETRKFSEVQKKSYTYFKEKDVLFAKVTPCMENGKIAIAKNLINGIGYGSSEFHVFRCSENLNNQYLFFFLIQSEFRSNSQHAMTGAVGLRRVPKKFLEDYSIPLAPLPEQRAIVTKTEQLFSELDNGIANLKTAKDKLEIYRQAVLKKAFEGELTKDWRKNNLYTEKSLELLIDYINDFNEEKKGQDIPRRLPPIDLTDLPEVPFGWTWSEAHKICQSVRDGTHDTPKYVSKGVPLVTSKNLKSGEVDLIQVDLISKEDHDEICKRSAVEKNDILYGMIGTIGNPVIVSETNIFSIKNVGLFKKNEKLISPKYLQFYLSSWLVEHIMRKKELIRGTTQKFVALGGLRVLPVPLPSIQEQTQIVKEIETRLSVCDNAIKNIDEALKKSEALRQSILKKAFEGKLLSDAELQACRQEPDWESAEKLLERIRKEKK